MDTEQIRIRLTPDETTELRRLADRFGLQHTALAALIVRAGMEAVKRNGSRATLPLQFEAIEEVSFARDDRHKSGKK